MTGIIRPRELVSLLLGLTLIAAMVATGDGRASAAPTDEVGAFTASKTVTRVFIQDDGSTETVDSRDVTLNVDHTLNLRGRERVAISWSGAHPSGLGPVRRERPEAGVPDAHHAVPRHRRPVTAEGEAARQDDVLDVDQAAAVAVHRR
jgi:hypothetical protein